MCGAIRLTGGVSDYYLGRTADTADTADMADMAGWKRVGA